MNILLVGINETNYNFRKIKGFYNAFSKIGDVEWVQDIFQAKKSCYDICFSELNIFDIIKNSKNYENLKIKNHFIWGTFELDVLIKIAENNLNTNFINLYKSDVLNCKIADDYIKKFGNNYQNTFPEGIDMAFFQCHKSKLPENLKIGYLPCSLSEIGKFVDKKEYDICYFGTLHNRPKLFNILNILSKKYKTYYHNSSNNSFLHPDECFNFYSKCKVSLSEQTQPVILELPVRLGESSANGCKMFILEDISINQINNKLIPQYISCFSETEMIEEIEKYLNSFHLDRSLEIYENFVSTYDLAIFTILRDYCK